jgi:hypothetical protein
MQVLYFLDIIKLVAVLMYLRHEFLKIQVYGENFKFSK